MRGAQLEEPLEPAAELGRRDLTRIGRADRRDVRGVEEPGLEERNASPEFDAFHLERVVRRTDAREGVAIEEALVREIVNRDHGWHMRVAPGEIGRRECRLPVVHMQHIGRPQRVRTAVREVGGGECQSREANVVVDEVGPCFRAVGRAVTLVERRREDDVYAETVRRLREADVAGGNVGDCGAMADDLHIRVSSEDLTIAGDEHANVQRAHERPRQGRRDIAEAADLHVIGHLRRDEQNAALQAVAGRLAKGSECTTAGKVGR